jgi:hypothetical protein
MTSRTTLLLAIAIAISSLSLGAPFDSYVGASAVVLAQDKQQRRFFPDDPIWREPMTQDVKNAVRYEPDLAYQTIENLFWRPGDKVLGQRAKNVNTVDEVPDGPYFVNRAGRIPLTPAIVARGANTSDGPAPGKWTVVSAKSDGVTPGFTIRDSANQLWFIKFDPAGWRGMATGSEIVAAKLFWAVGYHTAEYHIAQLVPSNLIISKDTRITPPGEMARGMNQGDITWLLSRADRDPRRVMRVILSKGTPGRPVGRIRVSRHSRRRPQRCRPTRASAELRGYFVFAAWLNHVDAKGINSLSSLITENGRSFIRNLPAGFRIGARQRGGGSPSRRLGRRRWLKNGAKLSSARCRSVSTFPSGARRITTNHRRSADCLAITRSGSRMSGGRTSRTPPSVTCAGRYFLGGDQAARDHRRHDSRRRCGGALRQCC